MPIVSVSGLTELGESLSSVRICSAAVSVGGTNAQTPSVGIAAGGGAALGLPPWSADIADVDEMFRMVNLTRHIPTLPHMPIAAEMQRISNQLFQVSYAILAKGSASVIPTMAMRSLFSFLIVDLHTIKGNGYVLYCMFSPLVMAPAFFRL